jgi:hypothetical protein
MTPMRSLLVVACCLLAACNSFSGPAPRAPLLSDTSLRLSTGTTVTLEQIAGIGIAGALIYIVYDPLAPNWQIEEQALAAESYQLSLRAKSFRIGGDGEAMQIFKRRAQQLQREKGYAGYRIVDYVEGIESGTPFTHRTSQGMIQLVGAGAAPVMTSAAPNLAAPVVVPVAAPVLVPVAAR